MVNGAEASGIAGAALLAVIAEVLLAVVVYSIRKKVDGITIILFGIAMIVIAMIPYWQLWPMLVEIAKK